MPYKEPTMSASGAINTLRVFTTSHYDDAIQFLFISKRKKKEEKSCLRSEILDEIKVVLELCIWNMVNRDMFHLHISFASRDSFKKKTRQY